jgi:hypothetical protein
MPVFASSSSARSLGALTAEALEDREVALVTLEGITW